MTADKPLLFPRYVWCHACNTFEAHTMSRAHNSALQGTCPRCGSNDLSSAPPAHYAKGKYQVTTYDAKDGFVGIAGMAALDVKAPYVSRGNGYMMSPRQLERFMAAYETRRAQLFELGGA